MSTRRAVRTLFFFTLAGTGLLFGLAAADVVAGHGEAALSESPNGPTLPGAKAKLDDLAWLEGTWRTTQGDAELEERWSAPLGDCLVGTFRWLRSSKVWMYEIMTISEEDGRIIFRLKHFTRELAGWEEKDEALTYPVKKIEPNRAVFENPERDHPRRFVYHRAGPKTLIVRLEGQKDGEATVSEFKFSRKKP